MSSATFPDEIVRQSLISRVMKDGINSIVRKVNIDPFRLQCIIRGNVMSDEEVRILQLFLEDATQP